MLECKYAQDPIWLPTIVDTELFAARRIPRTGRGLAIMLPGRLQRRTASRLHEFGFSDIEWEFVGRKYGLHDPNRTVVRYEDMPKYLSKYEYFFGGGGVRDPATKLWLCADSKTALEAMSLGVKTIRYDGSVRDTLPEQHTPPRVLEKLCAIYGTAW